MKKLMVIMLGLVFVASVAVAVPFTPTPLKLSAPAGVTYQFDGKELSIPVTVSGVGGSGFLLVSTKDKGAAIKKVVNGYLGWHEVNSIDTVLYTSPATALVTGSNAVKWSGKDDGGATVPAGSYTYYLWAIDTVNPRTLCTKQITFDAWGFRTWVTKDPVTGAALPKPVVYRATGGGIGSTSAVEVLGTARKWTIGSDPEDKTLLETTNFMGYTCIGGLALDPAKATGYFINTQKLGETRVTKHWSWVPNGASVLDTKWGTNGESIVQVKTSVGWYFGPGVLNCGKEWLLVTNSDISNTDTKSEIIYLDITDGSEVKRFDMAPWWVDMNEGTATAKGQYGGGPTEFWLNANNMFFLGSHSTCVNMMWDPYSEDPKTAVKWVNTNGDYTGDHNYDPKAPVPWVCNDYNVGPYKYCYSADNNNFSTFPSFDMGAVSFGLYGPDGTGMGYIALSGETAAQKMGADTVDANTAYDGFYTTNNITKAMDASFYYVGQDSFKGVISNQVGVADAAPAAFAVGQNSPNPFNPTTTISYTIPKAGKVSVEVFNVAGQKIDTLVNGAVTAGSHSVTWNASKVSAGVYFYTVKTDGFAKTMKMTLLK